MWVGVFAEEPAVGSLRARVWASGGVFRPKV